MLSIWYCQIKLFVIFFRNLSMQVIAENLSEEEISGLKELFKMIDTDNTGQITFEKLKAGLKMFGANLNEFEIFDLLSAVSSKSSSISLMSQNETKFSFVLTNLVSQYYNPF